MEINRDSDPFQIFSEWMNTAAQDPAIKEPTAMALATLGPKGQIHNRIVLCKHWSKDGLTFYTNYQSVKGEELKNHGDVGAVFFWEGLQRQIRVAGVVQKVSRENSVEYWRSRPRESQVSQYLSHQSQPVDSRQTLQDLWTKVDLEFKDKEIPCPAHWGGYQITPYQFEFWQGQPGRLHDRFHFEKSKNDWTFSRLYP